MPCHSCDENMDMELDACIEGRLYGQCDWPGCGGVCEYQGQCPCPCHTPKEEP